MQPLKLVALDKDDLVVISAQLQDAVLQVSDIVYQGKQQRFAAIVNRFDWAAAVAAEGKGPPVNQRRRAAVRFEHVTAVKRLNITQGATDAVLDLLAVNFEERVAPGGIVTLVFAGGGVLRLEVDCIEAELRDLGGVWSAKRRPDHGSDTPQGGSSTAES